MHEILLSKENVTNNQMLLTNLLGVLHIQITVTDLLLTGSSNIKLPLIPTFSTGLKV